MIYLQQLLNNVSPDELSTLKEMEQTGTETKVFDYILNQKDDFAVSEAAEQLELSKVHFRKTHSILLQKAYDILEPKGGLELLRLLARRNVHSQVKHELGKLEKQYLAENEHEKLKELFYNAVELFLNTNLSEFNIDFVNELAVKYKEYAKDEPYYKKLIPELLVMYYEQSIYSRKYASTDQVRIDFFKKVKERSKHFKEHLLNSNDPWAEFWYYNQTSHYYEQSSRDIENIRKYMRKAIETIDKKPEIFPLQYKILTNLNLGMSYYDSSDFEEAEKIFTKIFDTYPENLRGSIFFVDAFIQLNIAIGKNEKAKELIFFYYNYDQEKPYEYSGKHFGPLSILGLVYFLEDQLDLGYKCVQTAQQICVKSSYYYIESMIRIFENSYFFLTGEYDLAEQLTSKNIKYHQYKKCGEEGDFFIGYHKLIKAFIKCKFDNKKPSKKFEAIYKGWQEAEFRFIGKLLEKMRNSSGLDNWGN